MNVGCSRRQEKVTMEYDYEPMDETAPDGYVEEGEINSSGDEESLTGPVLTNVSQILSKNCRLHEKDVFVTGLNTFDESETKKKLDRAKRFSLPLETVDSTEVQKEKLSDLYKDLRIDKENERHYRFNAIHLRGTQNMSTEDVLQYFISYSPSHVEWINDVSCNVVWRDDISAARALLNLSKKVKNLEKVHLNADPFEKDLRSKHIESIDSDEAVDAREIKAAIPPGYWRIGVPCKKSSSLLLRYATRSDKKQRNAEKSSEYYRKYGNPHFGNIPGLISNSFRSEVKKSKMKASGSNLIWERSPEENLEKRNPWEDLAYEWGKMDKVEPDRVLMGRSGKERGEPIPDLRISLKNKKEKHKRSRMASEMSPSSSDKEAWECRSKIPRMKMYADDEEERLEKNLRRKFHSKCLGGIQKEDLRSKINRKKNKTRYTFSTEKKPQISSLRESSNSEYEYDDMDSGDWALEHYHDLRESLQHNKRKENKRYTRMKFESVSDDDDDDDDDGEICDRDLSRRSPLQIEIENDEYYLKKDQ